MKDRRSVKAKALLQVDRPGSPTVKALLRTGFRGAFALTWAAVGACGPSFQALYEGNARFEHCYALEDDPQAKMTNKADCWRDWSERYTYGQTRDRVQYAIARYVALSQASTMPTDEVLTNAAPGVTPRVMTIRAPAPTSVFAPPPKVLVEAQDAQAATPTTIASASALAPADRPQPMPAASCADQCSDAYRACGVQCVSVEAGSRAIGMPCVMCEGNYRTCMRACFK